MIDRNNAELARYLDEQDAAERRYALHRPEAMDNLAEKFDTDTSGAMEYLIDELTFVSPTLEALMHALSAGDTDEAGRLLRVSRERAKRNYIAQNLDAEIDRIAGVTYD